MISLTMDEDIRKPIREEELTVLAQRVEEDTREAFVFFKQMLKEKQGYPDILFPYSVLLYYAGATEEAEKYMEELNRINDHYELYTRARTSMARGAAADGVAPKDYPSVEFLDVTSQLEKNKALLKKLFFTGEFASHYYSILGHMSRADSRWRRSFLYYFASFYAGGKKDDLLFSLGQLCYSQGELTLAAQALGEGLKTNPHHDKMGLELSYVESELGRFDRARELLLDVFAQHPDWPDVAYRLAEYYYSDHNIEKALDYCNRALAVNPAYYSANMLKFRLLMMKDATDALEGFIGSLEGHPMAGIFQIFFAMKSKTDKHRVTELLKDLPLLKEEIIEGLWDDMIRMVDTAYLEDLFESLAREKLISEEEGREAIKRYTRHEHQ